MAITTSIRDTGDEPLDTESTEIDDDPEPCADGTRDHDDNPTTPCAPWTVCTPCTYVIADGSATTDRQCADCDAETFSAAPNQRTCTAWTLCGDDQYVRKEPDAAHDRLFNPCPGKTSSLDPNAAFCAPKIPHFDVIAAGYDHTCGLDEDGKAHCWGWNRYAQSTPPNNATFTAISVGDGRTCALDEYGKGPLLGRK